MSSFPIIKFLFRKPWPVLNEAMSLQPVLEAEEIPSVNEVVTFLSMSDQPMGLIISSIYDKNDLLQMANLIKMAKKVLPQTTLKVVMINFSMDKTLETAANKIGIKDIIDSSINTKALRFKLDFWIKALSTAPKTATENTTAKKLEPAEPSKKSQENTIQFIEALDCVEDIWSLPNEGDAKKILGRWVIKFFGPGPYAAQWVDHAKGIWRFDFRKEARDRFIMGDGDWFFRGDQKPDFIWKENTWLFSGESFELYYQEGSEVFKRASLRNKSLTVPKNSDYAKNKKTSILESFDQDLIIKKDSHLASQLESIDSETSKITNLSGKAKTDVIQDELLEGKISRENLPLGELSQKIKPGENQISIDPLGLDIGPQKLNRNWESEIELDQEDPKPDWHHSKQDFNQGSLLTSKAKNEFESSYDGKIGRDKNKKPLGENFDIDKEIDLDENGNRGWKKGFKEFSAEGYTGESETDQLNKFYKNKRDEEKGSDQEESQFNSDYLNSKQHKEKSSSYLKNSDSGYGGKSETDHFKNFYSNKKSNSRTDENEADASSPIDPFNSGKPMTGKSEKLKIFDPLELNQNGTRKSNKNKDAYLDQSQSQFDEIEIDQFNSPKLELESLDFSFISENTSVSSILSQGDLNAACDLDDFFDSQIIFKTNLGGLTRNLVDMDVKFKHQNTITRLSFEGNIINTERDEEGTYFVTVLLSEQRVKDFEVFMELFARRQKRIDFFLKRARGL